MGCGRTFASQRKLSGEQLFLLMSLLGSGSQVTCRAAAHKGHRAETSFIDVFVRLESEVCCGSSEDWDAVLTAHMSQSEARILRCNRSQFPGICQINSQSLFVFMHNVHTFENRCLQLENMWQHSQSALHCFFSLCEDLKEKGWAFFQRGNFLFNVGNFIAKWGAFWIFGKWRIFLRSGHVSRAGGFLKG